MACNTQHQSGLVVFWGFVFGCWVFLTALVAHRQDAACTDLVSWCSIVYLLHDKGILNTAPKATRLLQWNPSSETLAGCSQFSWIPHNLPVLSPRIPALLLSLGDIPELIELCGSSGERPLEGDECVPNWICFLYQFGLSAGLTAMLGCGCALPEINENCSSETESRFQSFLSALKLLTV